MDLDTKRIWAYDWRGQMEKSWDAIANRMLEYGIQGLEQEVLYHDTWQGDIDGLSPRNMEQLYNFASYLQGKRLYLTPVFVPGEYAHAELAGPIIKALGCGVIDLEWDSTGKYWYDPPQAIAAYANRIRELAPDAVIGWQPDSRIASRGGSEWQYLATDVADVVSFFEPQVYAGWGLYGTTDKTVQDDVVRIRSFENLGVPTYPTIYTAEDLRPVLGLLNAIQPTGFCAFRLGATGRTGLELIRDFQLRRKAPPPQEKTYQDGRSEVATEVLGWLEDDVTEIQHRRDLRKARLDDILGGN